MPDWTLVGWCRWRLKKNKWMSSNCLGMSDNLINFCLNFQGQSDQSFNPSLQHFPLTWTSGLVFLSYPILSYPMLLEIALIR